MGKYLIKALSNKYDVKCQQLCTVVLSCSISGHFRDKSSQVINCIAGTINKNKVLTTNQTLSASTSVTATHVCVCL